MIAIKFKLCIPKDVRFMELHGYPDHSLRVLSPSPVDAVFKALRVE